MEDQHRDVTTLVECGAEKQGEARNGKNIVHGCCSNYKSWDALGHTISSLLKVEKAGDNDGRADSGENKAEHEAPLPGKSQEHTSCDSHCKGLGKAGHEGEPEHHRRQLPQRLRA